MITAPLIDRSCSQPESRGRQVKPLDPTIVVTLRASYDGSRAATRRLADHYHVSESTIRAWARKAELTQHSRTPHSPAPSNHRLTGRIVLVPTHEAQDSLEDVPPGPGATTPVKDATQAYLEEMSRSPRLTAKEERALLARIALGDKEAKERMILSNLRLVVRIASRTASNLSGKIDVLDLIQEGNLGLMHAVETFDLSKGCRFSTHATWWIRQAIGRAVMNQTRIIRLPIPTQEQLRALRRLCEQADQPFSTDEAAARLSLSRERVDRLRAAERDAMSFDVPVSTSREGGDLLSLGDTIPSLLPSPEDCALAADLRTHLVRLLAILLPRERRVLERRYGLLDGRACPLEEIGREFGISRERVRQIERRALQKLFHTSVELQLHDYLEV